jgi:transglutaminase-like putative cysteine protease
MFDARPTRLTYAVELYYDVQGANCDLLLCLQAARTAQQQVVHERLLVSQPVPMRFLRTTGSNRAVHLRALPGPLTVRYDASVDVTFFEAQPGDVAESRIEALPAEVLPFLLPSRYCESDLIGDVARREFGTMWRGHARVQAICEWVRNWVQFESGSSTSSTTALQTLQQRKGVCRDFAHLMIALCRALNLPARFATGLDYGSDPALGPTDFHAYVEVYLSGRWYLFDPSGTAIPRGLVRISTGFDAADGAYATLFGDVRGVGRWLSVDARSDAGPLHHLPRWTRAALSTEAVGSMD